LCSPNRTQDGRPKKKHEECAKETSQGGKKNRKKPETRAAAISEVRQTGSSVEDSTDEGGEGNGGGDKGKYSDSEKFLNKKFRGDGRKIESIATPYQGTTRSQRRNKKKTLFPRKQSLKRGGSRTIERRKGNSLN